MEEKKDYAATLNLLKTSFKMKASLPNKEPLLLRDWQKKKIYEKTLGRFEKKFILHDGPPYANGDLHVGHAENKILKDIIMRYKRLRGYDAPYVPGWDTHGLPIELKVTEALGDKVKTMSPIEIRKECRKYALKWVEKQKAEFIRLGIMGEWENPYITLIPEYEAEELRVFKEIYNNGYIYKGLKPVYWSPSTETALAEAEIEYQDVVSPSIYVKMDGEQDLKDKLGLDEAAIVIWTTTPWTLPANLGISLHAEFDYGVYKTEKGNLLLAKELAETAFKEMEIENYELIKEVKGAELDNTHYKHPFIDRTGLVMLGDHVTLEAGTGAVHTAPGHGVDDYLVGQKYNIGILSPIDDKGHFTKAGGKYEGMFYKKANKFISEDIKASGHLLMEKELKHSYPHDWRSKKPVIYRATEQWFIRVEEGDLREKALTVLKDVNFIPAIGRNRITSMIEGRPDWTISRQRIWGVPIPIFYNDDKDGEIIFQNDIMDRIVELVEKDGTDVWFKMSAEELIGDELLEKHNLKGAKLRKERSIMDVWIDSGTSHRAVLSTRKNLQRPADLYLEGSDQHRGWFQSSLLTSVASTGDAPYKSILTHGFANDAQGRKMSKSLGNQMFPSEIINQYGADILRLWVASVDYREDVRISDNILKQVSDSYRRIRNTARFILGNISDFDYKNDKVSFEDMYEVDKWALNKLERLKNKVEEYYEKYEFYNLFNEIQYFCGIEMSAFYLDIIKDRLYVEKTDSKLRRSAQTVMVEILEFLVRAIAPVLSFTAEEIWEKMPETLREEESVHLAQWVAAKPEYLDNALDEKWSKIMDLRKEVYREVEKVRQEKTVGLSLDAKVELFIDNKDFEFIKDININDLQDYFIVSQIHFGETDGMADTEISGIKVKVTKADGEKCERCWKYDELGTDPEHPDVCPRCAKVLHS